MAKKKTTKKKQKPAGREVAIKRDGTPSDENQRIAEAALLGTKVDPAEAVAEINKRHRSPETSILIPFPRHHDGASLKLEGSDATDQINALFPVITTGPH